MLPRPMRTFLSWFLVLALPATALAEGVPMAAAPAEAPPTAEAICTGAVDAAVPGTIVVAADAVGLRVRVDGTEVGQTPLAPVEIAAGAHTIVLTSASGQEVARQAVQLGSACRVRVNVETGLTPDPVKVAAAERRLAEAERADDAGPWYTRWYVLGGAALAVAAGVLVVVLATSGSGGERGPAIGVPPIE